MWVEPTKTGKYKACERYTDPLTGKQRKVSVTIEKNTAANRKAAAKALADKIAKKDSSDSDMTLKELTELYLQDKKNTVRASTLLSYRNRSKWLLEALNPGIVISSITAGYINRCLKTSGKKSKTINSRIDMFKKIIVWAYQNDYVDSKEWLDKITPMSDSRKTRIEDKYLEPEALKALIDSMKVKLWQLLTRFLALTGMRIGEAIALTMEDIGKEYISINKTYQIGPDAVGDDPKTEDSRRDIFIQPELRQLIAEIRSYRLEEQIRTGTRSNLVFFQKGGYIKYNTYKNYLIRNSKRILGHSISPHVLRHTHVSILAAQGVPFDTIARRLGHRGDDVTKQVYFHVTQKLRQADNDAVKDVHIL